MSRLLDKLWHTLLKWPMIALLSLGVGLPPLYHLNLDFLAAQYVRSTLIFSFILALLQIRKSILPLTVGLFFIVQAALFPLNQGVFPQTVDTVRIIRLWLSGVEIAAPLFGELLCSQFALYLTLFCCLITISEDELYPPVFAAAAILALEWLLGVRGQSRYMLLVLPAVMLHYAATHAHLTRTDDTHKRSLSPAALPVLAVILLLSSFLAPQDGTVVDSFAHLAQEIRDFIDDNLFFDDERARYTLASDGWMPEGERQLGGPVTPSEQLIMTVQSDETVYLRGSIMDTYTGAAWYDAISSNRYHYLAPQYKNLRDELLQSAYPLVSQQQEKTLSVTMQVGSASTLFVPQRLRSLALGENMTAYFNAGSEIFITRNLETSDTYSASYLSMKATDSGMAALVAQNAKVDDPYYAQARTQYLHLPTHIQQEIYDIAFSVTKNCNTPWEKVVALRDYLKSNYRYDLNVDAPPESIDFVAWFLLAEKRGYCTYFASAMTVMCRILDLPARYVEGYLARPDQSGTAYVYGKNAHAWTEVYLNGVGWVTFDATAASGDTDRSNEGYTGDMQGESNAPTPSPEPQPTPSPEPDPIATPTPEPPANDHETPTPAPENQPPQDNPPDDDEPKLPWLLLLLLILLPVLLARRIHDTDPLRAADRAATDGRALTILWEASLACAAYVGLKHHPHETPLQFAARLEDSLNIRLGGVAEAVSAMNYGRHAPPVQVVPLAKECYLALREQMNLLHKLRFSLRCALRFAPVVRRKRRH